MYATWRACERFGIRPPGIPESWDDMPEFTRGLLIGYDQIRQHEDYKFQAALAGAKGI